MQINCEFLQNILKVHSGNHTVKALCLPTLPIFNCMNNKQLTYTFSLLGMEFCNTSHFAICKILLRDDISTVGYLLV